MILVRIVLTATLVGLAYYVGREVGRTQSIRDELERARRAKGAAQGLEPDPRAPG